MTGRTTVFSLALLAACLTMATAIASVAQAGEFTVNGSSFTSKGLASESFSGTLGETKLLFPGLSLVYTCKSGTLSGTLLLGGVAHVAILFAECSVEGNKFCKFYETKAKMESETEPGFFVISGLGELVLTEGKHYLLVSSGAGSFTTIYFTKSTKGCTALSLELAITGSFVLELPTALTSLVNQTAKTITQAEGEKSFPSDILKYGNQSGFVDSGSTNLRLVGANTGKNWGAE